MMARVEDQEMGWWKWTMGKGSRDYVVSTSVFEKCAAKI